MKYSFLILILLSVLFASCDDDDDCNHDKEVVLKDTVINVVEDYRFKIYPTAHNQFRIYVHHGNRDKFELVLQNGSENTVKAEFKKVENRNYQYYADVESSFSSPFPYRIMLRSYIELEDKVLDERFFIDNYRHEFEDPLVTEKLIDTKQLLDHDFSVDRKVLYFQDYVSNKRILKRLWLENNKIDVLHEDFFSSIMRTIDNDHIIVETNEYNGRYLQSDSTALMEYDVNTKESDFLAWAKEDGYASRIINNSLFVTDVNSNVSCVKIDLTDKSQEIYVKRYYVDKNRYDNIQQGNEVFNFETSSFEEPLPFLTETSSIQFVDEATQTYFVIEDNSRQESRIRLLVYRDGKNIFETEYGPTFLNFPDIPNLKDGKLIFYQRFDFTSEIRYDGYYELNLNSKTLKLIQADRDLQNTYPRDYFISGDNSWFISTKLDGIYKVTRKYIKD